MAPTLLGPVITAGVIVTIGVAAGGHDGLLGGPFMNWLIAVVVFGALSLLQGVCMLGFDALFARFCARAVAGRCAGRCAWIAGLAAPLPVEAIWLAAPPGRQQGSMFVVALLAPIVVCAGLVRLVAGAIGCR